MPHRFSSVTRGKPLAGARAIAKHIWDDADRWRSVYGLDRDAYGIKFVAGELLGFSGWIDAALAAESGRKRRRRTGEAASTETPAWK